MQSSSLIINRDNKDSKRISIITVCYNAVETLPATLKSIEEQSSDEFEFVVVDGSSNDGTLLLLEEHSGLIDRMISEPDKGIYDAMNKGIKLSRGKFLWFLNAGDSFHDSSTIDSLFRKMNLNPEAAIFYGDAMLVDQNRKELGLRRGSAPGKLNLESLQFGMDVCHQAFLVKRDVCQLYYTSYPLAADIDWMIRILKQSGEVSKTYLIFCNFLVGGMSSENIYRSWIDRYKVLRKHFGFWRNLKNHFRITSRTLGF